MNAIRLFYWRDRPNFGDEMSLDIVQWVSGRSVELVGAKDRKKLLAIGSILQHAQGGDVVWGTGLHPRSHDMFWINEKKWYKFGRSSELNISVHAIRGPLSRDALLCRGVDCPEIYGDPAILAPLIYPKDRQPTKRLGIIPHFRDEDVCKGYEENYIDVGAPWRSVVDAIINCEFVISSSLHGLIVAEAYGVPAVWLRVLNSEGYIKYADYYLGTNRLPTPAYSLEEAMNRRPIAPPPFHQEQLSLKAAFPAQEV